MPQFDSAFDNKVATGVLIGIGLAVLVPLAVVTLAPVVRPLARSALRAGAMAYEKAREGVAEFGEMAEDIVAEVQDELRTDRDTEDTAPLEDEEPETA